MKKIIILGALLVVSCAKIVETEVILPQEERITIPYSVTVSSDKTRATVDEDLMTLRYATGDKLYISCDSREDIKGVLELVSGAGTTGEGKDQVIVFSGNLDYSSEAGAPSDDLVLKATLVGNQNRGIQISENKVTGIVYPSYRDYCTDVFSAVEQYSLLTGIGTFGGHIFQLSQHTAFLNFSVKADGINSANVNLSVYFNNGGHSYMLGEKNTGSGGVISFTLPVAEGTVLENASINLAKGTNFSGTPAVRYTASFGGTEPKTLSPKVYRINKTAVANTGFVETGLPIIEITTKDLSHGASYIANHKDEEQHAQVIIHVGKTEIKPKSDNDVLELTIVDNEPTQPDPDTNCTIKGRGNSTWNWAKKPYKLKLEKKLALLQEMGLSNVTAKSKHWVLLANYMDRTMMRNMVAMEISSMMDNLAWTPHCLPVELYINGEHLGNYLLIEQVRVEDGRVDVKKIKNDTSNDVGFMMELDFHFDNYYGDVSGDNTIQWRDPHGVSKYTGTINFNDGNRQTYTFSDGTKKTAGIPFSIKEPDWSPAEGETHVNSDQLTYIKNYISAAGSTLYSKGNISGYKWWYNVPSPNPDPDNGYPKYLDVASFIDYWIVFETMINHEVGNPGSVYMTKPKNGKLTAGPCWDFDWGTLSYNYASRHPDPQTNLMNADAIWYESLMKSRSFVQQLYDRYEALLPDLSTIIPAKIDQWEREMAVSAELNFKMWNPAGAGNINGDVSLSYHDAVDRIKTIYINRLTFIEGKLYTLLQSLPANS